MTTCPMFDGGWKRRSRAVVAIAMLAAGAVRADERLQTHRDSQCGVAFALPPGWTVTNASKTTVTSRDVAEDAIRCVLRAEGGGHSVRLVVLDLPFLAIARAEGFIRLSAEDAQEIKTNARWGIFVRRGVAPASEMKTRCCQAVRGRTWNHDTAVDGSVKTVEEDVFVLNNRRGRTVVVRTDSPDELHSTVSTIGRSFAFTSGRVRKK